MKRLIGSACVAGALALAAGASAQPLSQPGHPIGDISGFRGGPQTLPGVVGRVEHMTGGKVIEARFSRRDGLPGFDVVAVKGGQLQYLRLGREDGALQVIRDTERPTWMLDWSRRFDVSVAKSAVVPLDDAILTAERQAGGSAVAAGLARDQEAALHAYNVLIDYPDGHTRRVAVDDNSGMVISNPGAIG